MTTSDNGPATETRSDPDGETAPTAKTTPNDGGASPRTGEDDDSAGDGVAAPATEDFVPPPRASIRRNLSAMMSSQVVTWVLATILMVLIPRYVGPAVQGQLTLASSLFTIGSIFVILGTSRYLRLEIARQPQEGLSQVGTVLVVRTTAFVPVAVLIGIYAAVVRSERQFVLIVAIMGVTALLTTWAEVVESSFIGLERMSVVAIVAVLTKLLLTVGVAIAIFLDAGIYAVLAVGIATSALALLQLLWRFRHIGPIILRGWTRRALPILRASIPFMAVGLALVLYQQIDVIVISSVAEDEVLGWYGTSDRLFASLLFPATIIAGTIFPTLGRLYQNDPDAMVDLVKRTFRDLILVGIPIGLGVVIVGPEFAPLLYGEEFRETGIVLAVSGPVVVLTFGTILFGTVALATDRARVWVGVLLISAALTIPLDLFLVSWAQDQFGNGAIGGAIAFVITESFQFAIGLWLIGPFLVNRRMAWYVFRIAVAGGVMLAIGLALRELPMLATIAVCAVVYVLLILAFRVLTDEQRQQIGEVLAKLGVSTSWAG